MTTGVSRPLAAVVRAAAAATGLTTPQDADGDQHDCPDRSRHRCPPLLGPARDENTVSRPAQEELLGSRRRRRAPRGRPQSAAPLPHEVRRHERPTRRGKPRLLDGYDRANRFVIASRAHDSTREATSARGRRSSQPLRHRARDARYERATERAKQRLSHVDARRKRFVAARRGCERRHPEPERLLSVRRSATGSMRAPAVHPGSVRARTRPRARPAEREHHAPDPDPGAQW